MRNKIHNYPAHFWTKVNKTEGCWEWRACLFKQGYGCFWDGARKKRVKAHRYSYEITVGPVPAGALVLHKCDNRKCVRPDHLFTGNHQDNHDDMVRKGRRASFKADKSSTAKLTWTQVRRMRRLWAARRYTQRVLATMFGVSLSNVWLILSNRYWVTGAK